MSKVQAISIAMTCYHAGSMAQRGKTIHPGTVQEWTDRITAHTNAEIAKVLDRLHHEYYEVDEETLDTLIEAERKKLKERDDESDI